MNIQDINLFLKENHKNSFPTKNQTIPFVLYHKIYNNNNFEYSLVIPVHNQEKIIINTLDSINKNITSNFEVIIILDNCNDKTQELILEFYNSIQVNFLVSVLVVKQETPIFETSCDNIGFKLSKGNYIIEIQADIQICEFGFEKYLSQPCKKLKNVIGVSGRCTHGFYDHSGYGKLGSLVEMNIDSIDKTLRKNLFYTYETCNRGPLLLDNIKLKELNYLDEENFYLDNSDHDLFARAYYQKNYICGYVPIEFKSPLENGSTRKKRDEINQNALDERKNRSNGGFLNRLNSVYKPLYKKIYYVG